MRPSPTPGHFCGICWGLERPRCPSEPGSSLGCRGVKLSNLHVGVCSWNTHKQEHTHIYIYIYTVSSEQNHSWSLGESAFQRFITSTTPRSRLSLFGARATVHLLYCDTGPEHVEPRELRKQQVKGANNNKPAARPIRVQPDSRSDGL